MLHSYMTTFEYLAWFNFWLVFLHHWTPFRNCKRENYIKKYSKCTGKTDRFKRRKLTAVWFNLKPRRHHHSKLFFSMPWKRPKKNSFLNFPLYHASGLQAWELCGSPNSKIIFRVQWLSSVIPVYHPICVFIWFCNWLLFCGSFKHGKKMRGVFQTRK